MTNENRSRKLAKEKYAAKKHTQEMEAAAEQTNQYLRLLERQIQRLSQENRSLRIKLDQMELRMKQIEHTITRGH